MPGFPVDSLDMQIQVVEMVARCPVLALTVNQEDLADDAVEATCRRLEEETGLPTVAPLRDGVARLVDVLEAHRSAAS